MYNTLVSVPQDSSFQTRLRLPEDCHQNEEDGGHDAEDRECNDGVDKKRCLLFFCVLHSLVSSVLEPVSVWCQ